jgi:hypothetical protein
LKISKKHLEIKLFGKYTVFLYSYNKIKFSGTNAAPRTAPFAKQSGEALPTLQSLKLLDQLRERIRYLHYSRSTEVNYVCWCRFFIRLAGKRHPKDMGKKRIKMGADPHGTTLSDFRASRIAARA